MQDDLPERLTRIERKADAVLALVSHAVTLSGGIAAGWVMEARWGFPEPVAYALGFMAALAFANLIARSHLKP